MSILDNLPNTATAKIRTRTKDSLGGAKDSYATVFSDRACWLQAASSNEVVEFQRRSITVTHKVFFTTDPAVDNRHILVISETDYKVQSSAKPDASAGMGVVYRVMVEKYGDDKPV